MKVFRDIYRTNAWNGVESLSGPGSGDSATLHVAPAIVALVEELGVRSVLDAACGDGYWMPDLPGYVGVDVAREAIARARARHPERRYIVGDVGSIKLPKVDMVITRDAMQHLSLDDGMLFLTALLTSGAKWLLASTYFNGHNSDITTGHFYSPDLMFPPFDLGAPDRFIFDGWDYFDGDAVRDPSKHLGLWPL